MNRERAKELLPIIQAFADGETIQIEMKPGVWEDLVLKDVSFNDSVEYRIKPKEQWRPFNCGELHRIVGKVVKHIGGSVSLITGAFDEQVYCEGRVISASNLLKNYVFVNTGDRCGVKLG